MKDFQLGQKVNKGSNSYIYKCIYKGEERIAKIPPLKNHYISYHLQVKSMEKINQLINEVDFKIPKVYYYSHDNVEYGEIVVMDKMEPIYPIEFVINNKLIDYQIVINKVAKALAFLHSITISGYDVEFYWDVINNELVLLDIGQQYAFGVSTEEMLKACLREEMKNQVGLWNIISCLVKKEEAIRIHKNNEILSIGYNDLIKEIHENSVELHIGDVARSHYIQIIGILNTSSRNDAVKLFTRIYKKTSRKINEFHKTLYIKTFNNSHKNAIKCSNVRLYYSKNEPLSIISNSNKIN